MKKQALTVLSLAIMVASPVYAGPGFYGKANVSLQSLREHTLDNEFIAQDNYELISNKSRFGLKGDEAINDSLKALYQFEWEVAIDSGDTGSGQALKQRNTFVGLGGGWGSVLAGIHDTPTKMLNKQIDLFNDSRYGDLENAVVGEVRHKNMLIYRSPVWAGVNFDVMVAPGEDKGSDSLEGSTANDKRNDAANAISAAVAYQLGGFRIGFGVDSKVEQKLSIGSIDLGEDKEAYDADEPLEVDDVGSKVAYEGETDLARLVASYDHAAFGVAGLLQHAKQAQGDIDAVTISVDFDDAAVSKTKFGKADVEELDSVALGGYVNIPGNVKLKALVIHTRLIESDVDFDQLAVGADYKLGKNTTLYGYAADVKASGDSKTLGHDSLYGNNSTVGIGIDHVFAF